MLTCLTAFSIAASIAARPDQILDRSNQIVMTATLLFAIGAEVDFVTAMPFFGVGLSVA